jgi:hypothetical protein
MSKIFYDKVVVSSTNSTDGRCLLGGAVGALNGVTEQETLQLTAQAYLAGNPISATFKWYSSNPDVASVDSTGLVTRVKNTETLGFDSNSASNLSVQANESFLGGISTIRVVALLPNGSESVSGEIVVAVQAAAPRQYNPASAFQPAASSFPSVAAGSFNLVDPVLVGPNYSK